MSNNQSPGFLYWASILIGISCFSSYYILYFFACFIADGACTGDSAAAVVMVYAIAIIPFVMVLSVISMIILIVQLILHRKNLLRSHCIGLLVYVLVFIAGTHELFLELLKS